MSEYCFVYGSKRWMSQFPVDSHPDLPILGFFRFPRSFRFAVFLAFVVHFCSLFQGFQGFCREEILVFFGGSSLFSPKQQGLEGQGVENPTKKQFLQSSSEGISLSKYSSEVFRVRLRRLSEYGSVAYLVERPTWKTRTEQYSDTALRRRSYFTYSWGFFAYRWASWITVKAPHLPGCVKSFFEKVMKCQKVLVSLNDTPWQPIPPWLRGWHFTPLSEGGGVKKTLNKGL